MPITEFQILRSSSRNGFTPGQLFINGAFECFTVEDEIRELPGVPVEVWKIPGKTAIPAGRYPLVMDYSNRFKCLMPHVMDVPGFEGIRWHTGNTAEDVEGCAAVGTMQSPTGVLHSLTAFHALVPKINQALADGLAFVTYTNPPALTT